MLVADIHLNSTYNISFKPIFDISDFEPRPVRQRNVRFEDTVSTETAQRMEDFKKVLQKEKDLQGLKNKVDSFFLVSSILNIFATRWIRVLGFPSIF